MLLGKRTDVAILPPCAIPGEGQLKRLVQVEPRAPVQSLLGQRRIQRQTAGLLVWRRFGKMPGQRSAEQPLCRCDQFAYRQLASARPKVDRQGRGALAQIFREQKISGENVTGAESYTLCW